MNDEQIDWPADLVTYSERAAYLRGLQASRATTPQDSVSSDRAAVDDPVAADGERAQFDAWWALDPTEAELRATGMSPTKKHAWMAWQARATLGSQS